MEIWLKVFPDILSSKYLETTSHQSMIAGETTKENRNPGQSSKSAGRISSACDTFQAPFLASRTFSKTQPGKISQALAPGGEADATLAARLDAQLTARAPVPVQAMHRSYQNPKTSQTFCKIVHNSVSIILILCVFQAFSSLFELIFLQRFSLFGMSSPRKEVSDRRKRLSSVLVRLG